MSLNSALVIGRSGLLANQAAIEVTGHNLANIATRGYSRQSIELAPVRGQEIEPGIIIGRGVKIQEIRRHTNEALEARLRDAISNEAFSLAQQELLGQIEALHNELTDTDLSSQLAEFFNAFSELANTPNDAALRTTVIQQSRAMGGYLQNMRSGLTESRNQVDGNIDVAVTESNRLLDRIAELNKQIVRAGGGTKAAHNLRDQRDMALTELAQYMDISSIEHGNGSADVFLGSLPLVLNNENRGLEVRRETIDDELRVELRLVDDGSLLTPASGKLGALLSGRSGGYDAAIGAVDQLAHQLIFQVNRIHSQGQAMQGFNELDSTVQVADTTAALNDPEAQLDFTPTHGSFQLHLTSQSTGLRTTTTINIDLDGIDPDNDTTLESLAATLNAVDNLDASVTNDGRLHIGSAVSDLEMSFSDDSSGVLAALGINTFFTGSDARDIDVNPIIIDDPSYVAAAAGHIFGDNRTALAIASLRDQGLGELNGSSLTEFWIGHVQDVAIQVAQSKQQAQADSVVRESLENQRQTISGVNADEEAINLLTFQRAYQGSARFISVVDEMFQTLLSLI